MLRLLPFVWLIVTPTFAANEPTHWFVGPDEIFDEIQPAIDAAAPGDVIWVEPTKDYAPFVLDNKGLTIRSLGDQFRVVIDRRQVLILNIPEGQRVALSGIRFAACPVPCSSLLILNSQSAVDIENVTIEQAGRVAVIDSPDVAFRNLVMDNSVQLTQCRTGCSLPLILAERSGIELSSCTLRSPDAEDRAHDDPVIAASVVLLIDSRALVSASSLLGGEGGDGPHDTICSYFGECTSLAGEGGAGVRAVRSFAQVFGRAGDVVWAGDSGATGRCCFKTDYFCFEARCEDGVPAAGVSGIFAFDSLVETAGVDIRGGDGNPPAPPTTGDVVSLPSRIPTLSSTTNDWSPGGAVSLEVTGPSGAEAFLLVSPLRTRVDLPFLEGSPLRIPLSPPPWVLPLGHLGQDGLLSTEVTIPDRPTLPGQVFGAQVLTAPTSGRAALSNLVSGVLGFAQGGE